MVHPPHVIKRKLLMVQRYKNKIIQTNNLPENEKIQGNNLPKIEKIQGNNLPKIEKNPKKYRISMYSAFTKKREAKADN